MGLLSNRVKRDEIKAGDHIYTWRAVYAYSHHGISIASLVSLSGFSLFFFFLHPIARFAKCWCKVWFFIFFYFSECMDIVSNVDAYSTKIEFGFQQIL